VTRCRNTHLISITTSTQQVLMHLIVTGASWNMHNKVAGLIHHMLLSLVIWLN